MSACLENFLFHTHIPDYRDAIDRVVFEFAERGEMTPSSERVMSEISKRVLLSFFAEHRLAEIVATQMQLCHESIARCAASIKERNDRLQLEEWL